MRLIQISAWNDSGGGFLHRLLDGHPELRSWPFELLLGRDGSDVDRFGDDWFRSRFRWPRLAGILAAGGFERAFDLIADTELKGVLRDPAGAKHREFPIAVDLAEWRKATIQRFLDSGQGTQAAFITAYVDAFFSLSSDLDPERVTLSHCPVAILDAPETWADLPETCFVCVVRSPYSGYADMVRRHPDLDPRVYARKWSLINGATALWAGKQEARVKVVTLPNLIANRGATMHDLCNWLGLAFDDAVLKPTWCGRPISEAAMGPFGGVPSISIERESALKAGLSSDDATVLDRGTAGVVAVLEAMGVVLDC